MKKTKKMCFLLVLLIFLTSFTYAKPVVDVLDKEAMDLANEKIEYFHSQYEQYKDFDIALENLQNRYKMIEVQETNKSDIYFDEKGKVVDIENLDVSIQVADLLYLYWNDAVYWDNDSNSYVYLGGWTWVYLDSKQPDDHIGIHSSDPIKMPISQVIVRGYGYNGNLTAHYITATGYRAGYIQLSTPTTNPSGVGFWINDDHVKNGTISAHLGTTRPSTSHDKVYLIYNHSYSNKTITGIGGNASKTGAGFSISWKTDVISQGPYYSPGAAPQ